MESEINLLTLLNGKRLKDVITASIEDKSLRFDYREGPSECLTARVVLNYFQVIGLHNALDKKDEVVKLDVLFEPFPTDELSIMSVSPLEGELLVNNIGIHKANVKPIKMETSNEKIFLEYRFLNVNIYFKKR